MIGSYPMHKKYNEYLKIFCSFSVERKKGCNMMEEAKKYAAISHLINNKKGNALRVNLFERVEKKEKSCLEYIGGIDMDFSSFTEGRNGYFPQLERRIKTLYENKYGNGKCPEMEKYLSFVMNEHSLKNAAGSYQCKNIKDVDNAIFYAVSLEGTKAITMLYKFNDTQSMDKKAECIFSIVEMNMINDKQSIF